MPTTNSSQQPPDPHRWRILGVTLVVGFMALLDVTIVNVAIPSMQTGLDTDTATIQWVVSGYALAFGLTLVAGGRLGDVHGRRALMMIGLVGFMVGSAASGLAFDARLVIAARALQGLSAGLLTPQSSGLIQQLFRGKERGIAFGYFGTTVGIASAIGPILGGALIALFGEENGWRYIFGINVPIGLVALVFVWRMVPGPTGAATTKGERHIDVVGAVLLGAAVFSLLLPVVESERGPNPSLWLLLAVPVFVLTFLWWERRQKAQALAPLLDVSLLRGTRGFSAGVLIGTVYFTGFTGVLLVLSIFLQSGLHYTALQTGLMLTPFALGTAVMSPIAGRLVSRLHRKTTVGAIAVMMSGLLLVTLLLPDTAAEFRWPMLAVPLLLAGLGGGAVVSPNQTLALMSVPPEMGGAAGAVVQTGQRIGSALGAALLVTAYEIASGRTSDPVMALKVTLGCSLAILLVALGAAIRDAVQEG
ncbi:MAG: MFS transporter [Microlunatus sp.]|nr:MFS transporter [Microlunatus sp.]